MQPEFTKPDFLEDNTAEEIHERMMEDLPADIDDMPGGFPFDFTMPAALEKAELIEFYLVRTVMIGFPQYAWGEWLDLHAKQVNLYRHPATYATGELEIKGDPGTEILKGTVFCTAATDDSSSIDFATDEDSIIGENGKVLVKVTALESGPESMLKADTITMMDEADDGITSVTNPVPTKGGKEEESDDDLFDRIILEYENSKTYLGNDGDYERWAKDAGAGECIVVPAAQGPGTVKLVLIDTDGQPADESLVENVYNHIVSPEDRSRRLLPTACASLICVAAETKAINYKCTGLLFDGTVDLEQIKDDFSLAVKQLYKEAKKEGVLRYNDVRPLISSISGVEDFQAFLINDAMENISFAKEEYPQTGTVDFS